jgi:hypothetical protein
MVYYFRGERYIQKTQKEDDVFKSLVKTKELDDNSDVLKLPLDPGVRNLRVVARRLCSLF